MKGRRKSGAFAVNSHVQLTLADQTRTVKQRFATPVFERNAHVTDCSPWRIGSLFRGCVKTCWGAIQSHTNVLRSYRSAEVAI